MILRHTLQVFPNNNSVTLGVTFQNKAMSYNMYSTWLDRVNYGNAVSIQFRPIQNSPSWMVSALGVEYSPNNFAPNGTSHYHVADSVRLESGLIIRPLDTPLLMFGNNSASWYSNWDSPPNYESGAWFNVFNQWNANWIIGWPWNEGETFKARYEISLL